jgi:hypothetical protein
MKPTLKDFMINPRVYIDHRKQCVVVNVRYPYEIDFDQLATTGGALDCIFQIASKTWADHALVGELVECLETLAEECCSNNAQGVWCPAGRPMRVDLESGRFEHDKPEARS